MNSDPYDSAAWRTFNMLDADESAIFDEAMRHDPLLRRAYLEMDRISAAIAATTALPIEPKPGQLERLQTRLGLNPSIRTHFWLAVSGWSAAAVLAILLILHLTGIINPSESAAIAAADTSPSPHDLAQTTAPGDLSNEKTAAKAETARLNREIEVLRENLVKFQDRDRLLFAATPGMALPIIMTMHPPGVAPEDPALAKNNDQSLITAMLGNALSALPGAAAEPEVALSGTPTTDPAAMLPNHPSAIPIYDAARDSGTLVVSNLPPADEGEVYNLWVIPETGTRPVYVGDLPENSSAGTVSFNFSLGSTMVLPSGFVLTIDAQDAPATPTEINTVLQYPPMPDR
jgi:hypothetical protein